ncbi:hypothetical protein [Nocardia suismassiliense]|uniref:hypothetical protein n=1 Tax=Nocardia suismassiliense TaxID=2077092 RepID=UPI001F352C9D|nr:hypothetical protein [Nocardia suismassiliense]
MGADGEWVVAGVHPATAAPNGGSIVYLAPKAPARVPPVLVVGACGGSGATVTTLGLVSALASAQRVVALDATVAGGDLATRGADRRLACCSVQAWLAASSASTAAPLSEALSLTSSGAGLLWRDPSPLPHRATTATICDRLLSAGMTSVVDGGSSVAARHLRPLLDQPDVRLVLTIPARRDATNRLRWTLQQLDAEFGGEFIGSSVLVVSHQHPDSASVAQPLSNLYRGWVRAVCEIPYDAHLADGRTITYDHLQPRTRRAYADLAAVVAPESAAKSTDST